MGILIGPPIGGLLQPIVASYTAMSCVGGALLYVIFILDESLSERSKAEVTFFHTCAFKSGRLMSHNWLHTPDCKVLSEGNFSPFTRALAVFHCHLT